MRSLLNLAPILLAIGSGWAVEYSRWDVAVVTGIIAINLAISIAGAAIEDAIATLGRQMPGPH